MYKKIETNKNTNIAGIKTLFLASFIYSFNIIDKRKITKIIRLLKNDCFIKLKNNLYSQPNYKIKIEVLL